MFDREHYEAIARIIRNLADEEGRIERGDLLKQLSVFFKTDNPRFDEGKFYDACYEEE